MAADVLDTIPGQLEVVEKELQILFEQSDQIAAKVKASGKVQQISRYLWRLPLKQYNGFNFSKFSANGGTLGPGTSMKLSNLEAGYFYSILAIQLTAEQLDTSQDKTQSVVDVLADTLSNAMIEQGVYDDIAFHQTGTGILTNPSSSVTATTMTFNSATDFLHTSMLREGMCVDVWDATGVTKRAAATADPIIIIAIDYDAYVITFNQTVTGVTTTDIIAFRGMAAYGPAALTSFASTYPGGPPANISGGIGGDSFRHGFRYMTDTTTSNYFYGKQKSTFGTQLNPVRVNAQNNPIEWDFFHRLIGKAIQKRDKDVWKKWTGIVSSAQRTAIANLGIAISTVMRTGGEFGKIYDGVPSNMGYSEEFTAFGIPHILSKRQDRSRIDYLNFEKVWRAQLFDTRWYGPAYGLKSTYEGRSSVDGTPTANLLMYVEQAYDFVCPDNGGFGVIDSLSLPAGWDA